MKVLNQLKTKLGLNKDWLSWNEYQELQQKGSFWSFINETALMSLKNLKKK